LISSSLSPLGAKQAQAESVHHGELDDVQKEIIKAIRSTIGRLRSHLSTITIKCPSRVDRHLKPHLGKIDSYSGIRFQDEIGYFCGSGYGSILCCLYAISLGLHSISTMGNADTAIPAGYEGGGKGLERVFVDKLV
jgi:hypothetical protein